MYLLNRTNPPYSKISIQGLQIVNTQYCVTCTILLKAFIQIHFYWTGRKLVWSLDFAYIFFIEHNLQFCIKFSCFHTLINILYFYLFRSFDKQPYQKTPLPMLRGFNAYGHENCVMLTNAKSCTFVRWSLSLKINQLSVFFYIFSFNAWVALGPLALRVKDIFHVRNIFHWTTFF